MLRAPASLKYLPAVLCGVLVAAWVASLLGTLQLAWSCSGVSRAAGLVIRLRASTVHVGYEPTFFMGKGIGSRGCSWTWANSLPTAADGLGYQGSIAIVEGVRTGLIVTEYEGWEYRIPVPFLISICIPVLAAAFTRFRFPLWSYFAWTALIAAELAYYLR